MHVGPGDGELTEHVNQPPPATTLEALEPSVSSPTTSFKYDCVYICIFACPRRGVGCSVGNPPTRESFPHINVRAAQRK